MNPAGFHTITLGCKLNQFDTAGIEGELVRRGFGPEKEIADAAVVVINTCTVTHRADADARKLIRSVRRQNDRCRLLVTGCYAEHDAEGLLALAGVDRVFGNRDKPHFAEILDEMGVPEYGGDPAQRNRGDRGCESSFGSPAALHFGERSRAFLRVQEGCRLACSYCIIPRVRGTSRSVAPENVLASAGELAARGYHEIVFTGVNTGDYGLDLQPTTNLEALLRASLDRLGSVRLRLNSLEPRSVTDGIVRLMADDPRLAPHLQIPLQSGSDETLRGMRRNYRRSLWLERLETLRGAVPHVGLGADVIVGFPGETEERFEESYAFIAASPLNYLHVFSWSPRPGTPAAEFDRRVPPAEIRRRSARLRLLGAELAHEFRQRFVGERLDAIVLGPRSQDGALRALTGNYIEVVLPAGSAAAGQPVEVEIVDVSREQTTARSLGSGASRSSQRGSRDLSP